MEEIVGVDSLKLIKAFKSAFGQYGSGDIAYWTAIRFKSTGEQLEASDIVERRYNLITKGTPIFHRDVEDISNLVDLYNSFLKNSVESKLVEKKSPVYQDSKPPELIVIK